MTADHQPTTERVDRVARRLAQAEGRPYEEVFVSAQAYARAIIEAVDTAAPAPQSAADTERDERLREARAHARVMRDMGRPHSTLVVLDDEVTRLDAVVTAVREKRAAWAAEDPATWDHLHVTAASAFRAAQYAIVNDLDEVLGDLPRALDGGAA